MWQCDAPGTLTHPRLGVICHDAEGWWWTPQSSGLKRGPFETAQEAIAEAEKEQGDG